MDNRSLNVGNSISKDSSPSASPRISGLMSRRQKNEDNDDSSSDKKSGLLKRGSKNIAWLKENTDDLLKTEKDVDEILNLLSEFSASTSQNTSKTVVQSPETLKSSKEPEEVKNSKGTSPDVKEDKTISQSVSNTSRVEEKPISIPPKDTFQFKPRLESIKEEDDVSSENPINPNANEAVSSNVLDELDILINEAKRFESDSSEFTEVVSSDRSKPSRTLSFDPLSGPPYRCIGCSKEIEEEFCKTDSSLWHPEHFNCKICNKSLTDEVFYEVNYELYCHDDYQLKFLPKCIVCKDYISEEVLKVSGKYYHPEHFTCCNCQTSLFNQDYFQIKGENLCKKCYGARHAPECRICKKPVLEDSINAMGSCWHSDCFRCKKCDKLLKGALFRFHEDFPYCEQDYHELRGTICFTCKSPITGSFVTACDRKFHPEHLICSYCKRKLSGLIYKEHNDKPYCVSCRSNMIE